MTVRLIKRTPGLFDEEEIIVHRYLLSVLEGYLKAPLRKFHIDIVNGVCYLLGKLDLVDKHRDIAKLVMQAGAK